MAFKLWIEIEQVDFTDWISFLPYNLTGQIKTNTENKGLIFSRLFVRSHKMLKYWNYIEALQIYNFSLYKEMAKNFAYHLPILSDGRPQLQS